VVGRASLFGLVAIVALASVWIARRTPEDLLLSPRRPYQSYGDARVRTETTGYPRHATGSDEVRIQINQPARRIVSQDAHADEYLYAVVPPEYVVGVSETAYEPRYSNVSDAVSRYRPVIANDPERVLMANPDLVFTAEAIRADMPSLLRRAGLPVYRMFTMFETLASIEEHIRLTGYLTGQDARADKEARRFVATLARASARRPSHTAAPRVLGLGATYSYGARTLFTDILRVLGAENVAATHGLVGYDRVSDELIVGWNPDWIIAGADHGLIERTRVSLSARPSIASTNAARLGHIVVLENRLFLPLSPLTSQLVDAISRALYGEAS
jgi:cobalamin transport system substrate-binding protein